MLPRSWRTAVGVLLAAAACSSPAHLPEAGPQGDRSAEPVLLPLLQPGRVLSFRGRSVLDLSAPDQAPAPRVGALFTRLRLLGQDGDTLRLSEESELAAADGESAAVLSAPRERRRLVFRVDAAAGEVALEEHTTAPRHGEGYGEPVSVPFTDDGFGLNAAARRAAGLVSLTLPARWMADLAAGRSVHLAPDFFMVRRDPLADRQVLEAVPDGTVPDGAEIRVRGETVLRPAGREPFPVDQRFPPPPPPGDPQSPPEAARPDARRELPALRVEVDARLEIRRARDPEAPATWRRDRLTWLVLDAPGPAWLLHVEGTVETRRGDGADEVHRSAFISRTLQRLEETSLDASGPPP